MQISQKSLEKFKQLYRNAFNEDLSDGEALEKATALLNLYLAVYGSPLEIASTQWVDGPPENNKHGQQ